MQARNVNIARENREFAQNKPRVVKCVQRMSPHPRKKTRMQGCKKNNVT